VPDVNELKLLASRQEQAFHEKFGYLASEVPGIWVGQNVAVNMLGGRGKDRQLAPTRASGMLEAISLDGVVLSVEDRVVFRPRYHRHRVAPSAQRERREGQRSRWLVRI
jgi:hypothetical protein